VEGATALSPTAGLDGAAALLVVNRLGDVGVRLVVDRLGDDVAVRLVVGRRGDDVTVCLVVGVPDGAAWLAAGWLGDAAEISPAAGVSDTWEALTPDVQGAIASAGDAGISTAVVVEGKVPMNVASATLQPAATLLITYIFVCLAAVAAIPDNRRQHTTRTAVEFNFMTVA
jgi:hypothetical protein